MKDDYTYLNEFLKNEKCNNSINEINSLIELLKLINTLHFIDSKLNDYIECQKAVNILYKYEYDLDKMIYIEVAQTLIKSIVKYISNIFDNYKLIKNNDIYQFIKLKK